MISVQWGMNQCAPIRLQIRKPEAGSPVDARLLVGPPNGATPLCGLRQADCVVDRICAGGGCQPDWEAQARCGGWQGWIWVGYGVVYGYQCNYLYTAREGAGFADI